MSACKLSHVAALSVAVKPVGFGGVVGVAVMVILVPINYGMLRVISVKTMNSAATALEFRCLVSDFCGRGGGIICWMMQMIALVLWYR